MKALVLVAAMLLSSVSFAGGAFWSDYNVPGHNCVEQGDGGMYVCFSGKSKRQYHKHKRDYSAKKRSTSRSHGGWPSWACDAFQGD